MHVHHGVLGLFSDLINAFNFEKTQSTSSFNSGELSAKPSLVEI